MGQLVLGVVGAAVGFVVGGPAGASVGFSLGSAIGAVAFPAGGGEDRVQPVQTMRITGVDYGQNISYIAGSCAVAGQIWELTTPARANAVVTESGGGKGGGGGPTNTSWTYEVDVFYGLARNQGKAITRVWWNGDLVYSVRSTDDAATVSASAMTDKWKRITFYDGNINQIPDPILDAINGAGNSPAYRGRSGVAIQGMNLGSSPQLPNLIFEFLADGVEGGVPEPRTEDVSATLNTSLNQSVAVDPTTGWVWHGGTQGNIKVLSDVQKTEIASFTGVGGSPGEAHSFCFVPMINEVWAMVRPFPVPSRAPYFHIFDAGQVDGSGNMIVAPTLKESVYITDTIAPLPLIDQNCCFYDASTGVILTAGAQSNVAELVIGQIDPVGRYVSWVWNTGIGIGYPSSIVGDNLYFLIHGHSEPFAYDNTVLLGPYAEVIINSYKLSTNYIGTAWHDDDLERFFLPEVGSLNYILLLHNGTYTTETLTPAPDADTVPPVSSQLHGGITYLPEGDLIAFGARVHGGNANSIYFIDRITRDPVKTLSYETAFNEMTIPMVAPPFTGRRYVLGFDNESTSHLKRFYYHTNTYNYSAPSVEEYQRRLCLAAGMVEGTHFDVSALSTITRKPAGLLWDSVSGARTPSEWLMSCYFYEAVLSGYILKFVPRGGPSVATIPFNDLGAHGAQDEMVDPLELVRNNDTELPAKIAVGFMNFNFDYQPDARESDRLISDISNTVNRVSVNLAMTPEDALIAANAMTLDMVVSLMHSRIAILYNYTKIEPTDAISVIAADGSTLRMRVATRTDQFPMILLDVVMDDVSVLDTVGITDADYDSVTTVAAPISTQLELMDIPMLRDADDNSGVYAAVKGSGGVYPGAVVLDSRDNVTYQQVALVPNESVIGVLVTGMDGWTGGRVFDETTPPVRVNVGTGTLSSATRSDLIADRSVNAALIGDDHLLQFIRADLVSTGVYDLSGFLHADHGMSSVAAGHTAGERFVLLTAGGVRRAQMQNTDIGIPFYWKGVTSGRPVSSATAKLFTNNGASLKPLAPWDLRIARDGSGNITGTFQRRSRLSVRTVGPLPISVPLGETSESFLIEAMDGVNVARAISSVSKLNDTTYEFTYSAADQTTDYGSPQASIDWRVTQLSDRVGRGYPLEVTK